jgi:deoxyribodipyrimidine photo-lyase
MNPDRDTGLQKLALFLPHAGASYAQGRNFVPGVVSGLSPYVRHRLITEAEIVRAVLQRHSLQEAEKFIQEVCWRTYWKGWLQMRPMVWSEYMQELGLLRTRRDEDPDLHGRIEQAELGKTGIECLDDWVEELRQTGYLHNHVRMWFASIWVHTLRLPWQAGADFFMRYLLDGDPASNTLSWRWVCGLQTQGKVYLATAENIERFTDGRYAPYGALAKEPPPMTGSFTPHPPIPLGLPDALIPGEKTLLLVTEEDLWPEDWQIPRGDITAIVLLDTALAYPGIGALVSEWKQKAIKETSERLAREFDCPVLTPHGGGKITAATVLALLHESGARTLSVMTPPVGPTLTLIEPLLHQLAKEGVILRQLRRSWDHAFWPHATHGFFKLKERIPLVLKQLFLSS